MAPAEIERILTKGGLTVYSSRVLPGKKGPLLALGANYAYRREDWDPLDSEESEALQAWVIRSLGRVGYKTKMVPFEGRGEPDFNDFRLRILLKAEDIEQEHYERIKAAIKKTSKALAVSSEPLDVPLHKAFE